MLTNMTGKNNIGAVVVATVGGGVVGAVTRWGVVGHDHTLLGQGGAEMLVSSKDSDIVPADEVDPKTMRAIVGWLMAFQRKAMQTDKLANSTPDSVTAMDEVQAHMRLYGYMRNNHAAPTAAKPELTKDEAPTPTPTHRLVSSSGVLGLSDLETGDIAMFYMATGTTKDHRTGTLYDGRTGTPIMTDVSLESACTSLGIRLMRERGEGRGGGTTKMNDSFTKFAARLTAHTNTDANVSTGNNTNTNTNTKSCLSRAEAEEVISHLLAPNPSVYAGMDDSTIVTMATDSMRSIEQAMKDNAFHPSVVRRLRGWIREWQSVRRRHTMTFGETSSSSKTKKISPSKVEKKAASAQIREKMRGRK